MEKLICVIYVGIAGIRAEDVPTFVRKVTEKISPTSVDCEIISIPVQSIDTKIECINPKYVTEDALIIEHIEMMKKLQDALNVQLDIIKNNEEK